MAAKRKIVISERDNIAALFEGDQALEFIIHRGEILLGDVYLAEVENILPSIDAAFVNVGGDKMGFLHSSDVQGRGELKTRLKPKQKLVVQVMKEPTGHKGPRVTTNISLPGRFLVLMPEAKGVSLSRKIENANERNRLKSIVSVVKPSGVGIIIRTEAEGQSEADLQEDFEVLLERWQNIVSMADSADPPALLYRDQDLLYRVIREMVTEDVDELVVDTAFGYQRAQQLLQNWNLDKTLRVSQYNGSQSIMVAMGVEREIRQALQTKVSMPSGGYLYIQHTEALTVVDVNSGRFTSLQSQSDTIRITNLEACKEIARQLRLRNIGGMVVVDFIDMESRADQLAILQAFEAELEPDKAKPQVGQLTDLGLVEMTRHRQGQALAEIFASKCQTCMGTGQHIESFTWASQTMPDPEPGKGFDFRSRRRHENRPAAKSTDKRRERGGKRDGNETDTEDAVPQREGRSNGGRSEGRQDSRTAEGRGDSRGETRGDARTEARSSDRNAPRSGRGAEATPPPAPLPQDEKGFAQLATSKDAPTGQPPAPTPEAQRAVADAPDTRQHERTDRGGQYRRGQGGRAGDPDQGWALLWPRPLPSNDRYYDYKVHYLNRLAELMSVRPARAAQMALLPPLANQMVIRANPAATDVLALVDAINGGDMPSFLPEDETPAFAEAVNETDTADKPEPPVPTQAVAAPVAVAEVAPVVATPAPAPVVAKPSPDLPQLVAALVASMKEGALAAAQAATAPDPSPAPAPVAEQPSVAEAPVAPVVEALPPAPEVAPPPPAEEMHHDEHDDDDEYDDDDEHDHDDDAPPTDAKAGGGGKKPNRKPANNAASRGRRNRRVAAMRNRAKAEGGSKP
jgi:Rne/Rng family ribonuclease